MSKSADAFRTISEVAEWLDTPAHVLRFWESKFTQVKPVKRAGGRRYYRPADMRLIGGIKKLLHEDGMTIKGVQKILREKGIKHVSSLCTLTVGDEVEEDVVLEDVVVAEPVDTVVPFAKPEDEPAEQVAVAEDAEQSETDVAVLEVSGAEPAATENVAVFEPEDAPVADIPGTSEEVEADEGDVTVEDDPALPAFLQRTMFEPAEAGAETDVEAVEEPSPEIEPVVATPEVDETPPPNAVRIDGPGALVRIARIRRLSPDAAREIAPVVDQLRALAR